MSTTTARSSLTGVVAPLAAPVAAPALPAADAVDIESVVRDAVDRILADRRLRGHIEGHDLSGVRTVLAEQTRSFLRTGECPLLGPDGGRYRRDAVAALRGHWAAARDGARTGVPRS